MFKPQKPPGHKGSGPRGKVELIKNGKPGEEDFNLNILLADILRSKGIKSVLRNDWLILANKLMLRPEIVEVVSLKTGGFSTLTTLAVAHERLLPNSLFEYQQGVFKQLKATLGAGLAQWVTQDLPVFMEALSGDLKTCMAMDLEVYKNPLFVRRALLGPINHRYSQNNPIKEEHPFCQCCLLSNTYKIFEPLLTQAKTIGLHMAVYRDTKGQVQAECRINGIDWPPGADALKLYGQTWPDRGEELRRQYVLFYTSQGSALTPHNHHA